MERPSHPVQPWVDEHEGDYELLAKLCRKLGWKTKAVYLKQIVGGYYRPRWDKAAVLAQAVGGGVTTDQIMSYPYTRSAGGQAA